MDTALALPTQPKLRPDRDPDAVSALASLLGDDMNLVNELIVERMDSSVALIPVVASHLIQAGGKRLRPLITLATARLFDAQGVNHVKLAAAVEFIHTATLLHDDVVDASALRRGNQTANMVWGNQASVLVGDFLFAKSFNLMVEVGDIRILDILASASSVIAEGEVMQLAATADIDVTRKTYLDIVAAKTAALFAAAARVGGVSAGCSRKHELALEAFGRSFGIAFQLVDDALDYSGRETELGKSIGDDFREGKITLPVVLAYARGGDAERIFWRRVIESGDQREGDFAHALTLLNHHDTMPETIAEARRYAEEARGALDHLPDNAHHEALDRLVDFCIDRAY